MKDRFIILLEAYLSDTASPSEKEEFESIIKTDEKLKQEYLEQKRIKEVLKKMKLKNPTKEFWDSYWEGSYNKLERGLSWLAISIGAIILLGFAGAGIVEFFFEETQTPALLKLGIGALIFGVLFLLFSVAREKFSTRFRDKYKEIQR